MSNTASGQDGQLLDKEIAQRIDELEKHIETMHFIMAQCASDEAYRIYSRRLDEFHQELRKLRSALEGR